jgi:hypothetical protein
MALEREASLDAATLLFMQHVAALLPSLLGTFLLLESREFIDHDLSVPAVSMILVSCVAWAASAVGGLFVGDGMPAHVRVLWWIPGGGEGGRGGNKMFVGGNSTPVAMYDDLPAAGAKTLDACVRVSPLTASARPVRPVSVVATGLGLLFLGLTRGVHALAPCVQAKDLLKAAAPLGTVVTSVAVLGLGAPMAVAAAVAATIVGLLLRLGS